MAEITFTSSGILQTSGLMANVPCQIEEITFYISPLLGQNLQMFLVLRTPNKLTEIIELTKVGVVKKGTQFSVPLKQELRVNGEKVALKILLIDPKDDTYRFSNEISATILTSHYKMARQAYIASSVGQKTEEYYKKIVALTQLNQELYDNIRRENKEL